MGVLTTAAHQQYPGAVPGDVPGDRVDDPVACVSPLSSAVSRSILERNQGDYMQAERDILTRVVHPFIVQLQYSFQVCGHETLRRCWREGLLMNVQAFLMHSPDAAAGSQESGASTVAARKPSHTHAPAVVPLMLPFLAPAVFSGANLHSCRRAPSCICSWTLSMEGIFSSSSTGRALSGKRLPTAHAASPSLFKGDLHTACMRGRPHDRHGGVALW